MITAKIIIFRKDSGVRKADRVGNIQINNHEKFQKTVKRRQKGYFCRSTAFILF